MNIRPTNWRHSAKTRPVSPPTRAELLDVARQQLVASNTAALDAEILLAHTLGLSRTQLITWPESPVDDASTQTFQQLIARRRAGEPVAYLTGVQEFWSLDLHVTPDVLIPRADTEILVEYGLALIPEHATWRIADLGTGSGAIALALASERRTCQFVATDRSPTALAVARSNATRLHIPNIEFLHGSWLEPLAGRYDIIVSNPPYIAENDPHLVDLGFEPASALTAGHDGLEDLRQISRQAGEFLQPAGWLLLEHGYEQAAEVKEMLTAAGFQHITTFCDIAGLERVTQGQRP